jgi:hypothetical protein
LDSILTRKTERPPRKKEKKSKREKRKEKKNKQTTAPVSYPIAEALPMPKAP